MDNHFNKFIERISFYKTSIFQIDTHLKEFAKNRKANLPKDSILPILGSRLAYKNVLTLKYEVKELNEVNIENIEEKILQIKINYSNFCISQCFEAFTTYLKDILCQYIISNKEFILNDAYLKDKKINLSSYESLRNQISDLLKYNENYFDRFYKINSELKKYEKNNLLYFDFQEWNIVFTKVRHSIVHSNAHLKKDETKSWTKFKKILLKELFTEAETENEIIISTFNSYNYIIEKIAQHAQLIFDKIKESKK